MHRAYPGTKSRRTRPATVLLLVFLLPLAPASAADAPARFTGSPSCATSMCHGGAGELRHQTTIWQKQDIHSRTYNTLVNARSAQIAAALKIPDATTSSRCTTCHAPFHDVPKSAFLADIIKPTEDQVIFVVLGAAEGRGDRAITALGMPYLKMDAPCYAY